MIANGSGNTADFSTLNIAADTTVNLAVDRTIGNLVFGDTDASSAASWTLAAGNPGGKLTLAGTTPTITVNALGTGKSANITAIIDGTGGFTKAGAGNLILHSPANTISGAVVLSGGILQLNAAPLGAGPVTFSGNSTLRAGGAFTVNNAISIAPGVTGTLDTNGNNTTLGGALTGSGTLAKSGSGTLTLTGGLNNTLAGTIQVNTGTLRSTDGSSFKNLTGGVTVASGASFYFGQNFGGNNLTNALALSGSGTGGNGALNLAYNAISSGAITLDADATISHDWNNASINGAISGADRNLTLASTRAGQGPLTVNGNISLGSLTVSSTLTGPNGLIINDAQGGTVVLTGARDYTGPSIVKTGTLRAHGTLNGAVSVMGGGMLAPGPASGTGSLALDQALTVDGRLSMRIDRAATQKADLITAPSLSLNGTLTVLNTGAALQAGDTFQLFSVSGSISQNNLIFDLPVLDPGLTWDFSSLAVDGSLTVSETGNGIGDPNFPELLPSQLQAVRDAGQTSATINPGTYNLPDGFQYQSTFTLNGWSDFTIDCGDAVFTVGKQRAFQLNNCNNVTIRNLTVRARYPSFTQGRVLSKGTNPNGSAFAIWEISDGYPTQFAIDENHVPVSNEVRAGFSIIAADGTTGIIDHATGDNYGCILTPQGGNTWKVDYPNRNSLPFKINDWLVQRLDGSLVQSHAIFLNNSTNCTIESVTSQGGGFATFFENGGGFQIINCELSGTRSRAIITKADNGLISGCTIEHSGTAIKIGPEYYWNESGYCWNVIVENTIMTHCNLGIHVNADGAMGNRNIIVRNNTFGTMLKSHAILLEGCDGATIRGNSFGAPLAAETIRFEYSKDVTLANNLVAYSPAGMSLLRGTSNVTNLQGSANGLLYSGRAYALTNSLSGLLLAKACASS